MNPENDDQKVGIDIVRRALRAPARQIFANAGEDGSIIVGKLLEKDDINHGFDAQSGTYVDMVKAGIIDPTKVVRLALQGAASVAGLLVTTEVILRVEVERDSAGNPVRDGQGRLLVHLAGSRRSAGQGSHVLSTLATADALAAVAESFDEVPAGTTVEVSWLDHCSPSARTDRRTTMDHKPQPRSERRRLTHVDRAGRPRMVDVSSKPATARRAVAEALVALSQETLSLVIDGRNAKGDVLSVAELAGVMGAKRTSDLIPLCHPLALTDLLVQVVPDRAAACCASGPRPPRPARPGSRWRP